MDQYSDTDLNENVETFRAATESASQPVPTVDLHKVLVALDGSNQDAAVLNMAAVLISPDHAHSVQTGEGKAGLPVGKDFLDHANVHFKNRSSRKGPAFQSILDAWEADAADMILVAAPHGEDYRELGDASVGTNVDILMRRRPVPLLVLRAPEVKPAACLQRLIIPVNLLEDQQRQALSWSFAILREKGTLELLAVIDEEILREARRLAPDQTGIEDAGEMVLAGLAKPEAAGLIATAQKACVERGVNCRVVVRSGAMVEVVSHYANDGDAVLVTGCPSCGTETGCQRVVALLRASRNPVLVV